ncbi:small integral membrane protein 8 isoform 1 [Danio rerio]|uniref:Small integral membrane protein 8 n=1 Tax=Danio rerio TaxID=7955 RepID=F1QLE8_DANRE|nr:small integral membrane protein 8 isoform 1 [Danio rerio]|eukprot:NP_001019604.2 small integral membrane protein 8 isoform 1 [Danio rerio]
MSSGQSSSSSGKSGPQEPPSSAAEPAYRSPGLRGVRTTSLFRAVNPELFIRPNKPVMALGLLALSVCVGYLGYLHAIRDSDQQLYEAVDSDGETYMRRRTSRWD